MKLDIEKLQRHAMRIKENAVVWEVVLDAYGSVVIEFYSHNRVSIDRDGNLEYLRCLVDVLDASVFEVGVDWRRRFRSQKDVQDEAQARREGSENNPKVSRIANNK